MAFPHAPGLTPPEVAFLCEMELVTIVPRQRLEGLELLGGPTKPLVPPHRSPLPLWLALLLKRQRRANILPPPWLHPDSLSSILELETKHIKDAFAPPPPLDWDSRDHDRGGNRGRRKEKKGVGLSPPFISSCTADANPEALPYHWLEVSELLLSSAPDDLHDPDLTRRLLRDLREVRMAKMRKGIKSLDGEHAVQMTGVGAMEVAEGRGFITGVVEGMRKIGASREAARLEDAERGTGAYGGGTQSDNDDDDDDMQF